MRGKGNKTLGKIKDLFETVAESPGQSATFLAALAGISLTSPFMAAAGAAAGLAFLSRRQKPPVGLLGGQPLLGMKPRRFEPWETYLIGRHAETGEALRVTNDVARQHFLVLGAPGGGRSEVFTGMSESLVALGSGVIHVDGRGDGGAARRLRDLAFKHGRQDDILVLDLRKGDAAGPSHTLSPFMRGSSDTLVQVLVNMIPDDGRGDVAMLKGRATAWLVGLMLPLALSRDKGVPLKPSRILANIGLESLMDIAGARGEWDWLPREAVVAARSYLSSLPGYVEERGARQSPLVNAHHAQVSAAIEAILEPLVDVYPHVFEADTSEICFKDLLRQRRLAAVILPPPDGSGMPAARLVVSLLKSMMGHALGNRIEGTWDEILSFRTTASPHPYLCILDDVGEYAVEGLALMAAQARSLGFSMAYGADDLASLKASNEREAASIVANTNSKLHLYPRPFDVAELAGAGQAPQYGTLAFKAENIPFESHVPLTAGNYAHRGVGRPVPRFVPLNQQSNA